MKNDVTSFMYFMWNMWSQSVCHEVFAGASCGPHHIWNKWCEAYNYAGGAWGATELFFRELDKTNRDILVAYAITKYNGGTRR